jgi:hypothetical protein
MTTYAARSPLHTYTVRKAGWSDELVKKSLKMEPNLFSVNINM